MNQTRIGFAVLLTACLAHHAQAQPKGKEWPVFRGNSLQAGVADSPLPDALQEKWSFDTKKVIEGSPVIAEQTVFAATTEGKLIALELATGKKKWEYQAGSINASPSVHQGAVYVGDTKGIFHCVDSATGNKRWTVAADGEIFTSANFAQDKIVFGSNDHNLYCVDNKGKLLWQCLTKEKIRGTPAIVGDRVLVGGCDQFLHVVDLASGKELSSVALGAHVAASVAIRDDHVYVGNMGNQFLAVDWKKGAILWKFESPRNPQPFKTAAAVTDDLVIAPGRDKKMWAWQRQTGKEAWTFAVKSPIDSSPVVVGKRVLFGSLDGFLHVLDVARGAEMTRIELGPIGCSPAIADERVVVATLLGRVVCLGAR